MGREYLRIHPFPLKNVDIFHPSCHVVIFHLMEYAVVHSGLGWNHDLETAQTFERLGLQHFLMPMFWSSSVTDVRWKEKNVLFTETSAKTGQYRFQRFFMFIPIPGEMIKFH